MDTTPRQIPLYINGARIDAGARSTFDAVNPVTGEVFAQVVEATERDVDDAVKAAAAALEGPWGTMPARGRLNLLRAVADRIDARSAEFLAAEIEDTGKPKALASAIDIPRGAANFRAFAHAFEAMSTETYRSDTPDGRGALNYALRKPVGVVGVICPWNLPLLLMTWKVAPALAAGCTVVVKPSEETPQTATLLAEVMREVGVPDGVYNVVHGFGPGSAGAFITEHPGVSALTFTGESGTGRAIMGAAAKDLKKLSFELGGKNPSIVFADCDLEEAIKGSVRSVFTNCGQVCLTTERIYVERSIYSRFVEGLAKAAKALRPGTPYEAGTTMGPLVSKTHYDKVLSYYALAKKEGARVVAGGKPLKVEGYEGGFFVEPTIWTNLSEDSRCVKEEIFGPVCHIAPFDTEEQAIAMANDSVYGLCGVVWTENLRRAHRVASKIEAGIVWVNSWYLRDLRTPFGGVKASGLGREGGVHSFEFYTELTNICIKL